MGLFPRHTSPNMGLIYLFSVLIWYMTNNNTFLINWTYKVSLCLLARLWLVTGTPIIGRLRHWRINRSTDTELLHRAWSLLHVACCFLVHKAGSSGKASNLSGKQQPIIIHYSQELCTGIYVMFEISVLIISTSNICSRYILSWWYLCNVPYQ